MRAPQGDYNLGFANPRFFRSRDKDMHPIELKADRVDGIAKSGFVDPLVHLDEDDRHILGSIDTQFPQGFGQVPQVIR